MEGFVKAGVPCIRNASLDVSRSFDRYRISQEEAKLIDIDMICENISLPRRTVHLWATKNGLPRDSERRKVLENVELAPIRRELALRSDDGDAEIFAGVQIEIENLCRGLYGAKIRGWNARRCRAAARENLLSLAAFSRRKNVLGGGKRSADE